MWIPSAIRARDPKRIPQPISRIIDALQRAMTHHVFLSLAEWSLERKLCLCLLMLRLRCRIERFFHLWFTRRSRQIVCDHAYPVMWLVMLLVKDIISQMFLRHNYGRPEFRKILTGWHTLILGF